MAELRLCPWFITQSPEIFSFIFFFFFGLHCVAYGISVPQPGIEPTPLAVELWSPNHWTAREFSGTFFLMTVRSTGSSELGINSMDDA